MAIHKIIIILIILTCVKSELSIPVLMRAVWPCEGCRTHWAAVPAAFGCSLAPARPETATATASASACRRAGSVLWPRSPGRTLWMGRHKLTPRFHSEWSTVHFSVPPLTKRKIKHSAFDTTTGNAVVFWSQEVQNLKILTPRKEPQDSLTESSTESPALARRQTSFVVTSTCLQGDKTRPSRSPL